jgi:diguanylate cyclase (GGDEF)-like protein
MGDEDRKENLGQIAPTDSQALSNKSASFIRRGLRSLSGWDSVIIEVGKALTSSLQLHEILRTIMEKVDEYLHPDTWSLLLVDEDKQDLYFELAAGKGAKALKDVRIKLGEGIAGWVAQRNEAVIVPDVSRDTRFFSEVEEKTTFEIGSIVAMPIRHRDRCLGVIELTNSVGHGSLSQGDFSMLEAVADFIAVAIENDEHVRRLVDLTITDDSTQLYNARHMDFILDTEIYRSKRYGYTFSVAFIAIESQDDLTKSLSYSAFRQLLKELALLVKSPCRRIDFAFRYQETEFVLVLPQATKDTACLLARRLHRSVRETTWLAGEGLNLRLTASIGVASYPDDAGTKRDLLHRGDEALYLVKNASRDGVAAANVGLLDPL